MKLIYSSFFVDNLLPLPLPSLGYDDRIDTTSLQYRLAVGQCRL